MLADPYPLPLPRGCRARWCRPSSDLGSHLRSFLGTSGDESGRDLMSCLGGHDLMSLGGVTPSIFSAYQYRARPSQLIDSREG